MWPMGQTLASWIYWHFPSVRVFWHRWLSIYNDVAIIQYNHYITQILYVKKYVIEKVNKQFYTIKPVTMIVNWQRILMNFLVYGKSNVNVFMLLLQEMSLTLNVLITKINHGKSSYLTVDLIQVCWTLQLVTMRFNHISIAAKEDTPVGILDILPNKYCQDMTVCNTYICDLKEWNMFQIFSCHLISICF